AALRVARAAPSARPLQLRATQRPFVLANVRYAVFANPVVAWTIAARKHSVPAGQRLELVAVRIRNLGSASLDPGSLYFQLETPDGRVYQPLLRVGNAGTLSQAKALGHNGLTIAQLAFAVPAQARGLHLVFRPSPDGAVPVAVPLEG
ncbi:MAG: DUF4352 domain-containing protein, partial [Solirubrobacteraceae bacterium]